MALSDSRRLCAVTYGLLKGSAFLRKIFPAWSLPGHSVLYTQIVHSVAHTHLRNSLIMTALSWRTERSKWSRTARVLPRTDHSRTGSMNHKIMKHGDMQLFKVQSMCYDVPVNRIPFGPSSATRGGQPVYF